MHRNILSDGATQPEHPHKQSFARHTYARLRCASASHKVGQSSSDQSRRAGWGDKVRRCTQHEARASARSAASSSFAAVSAATSPRGSVAAEVLSARLISMRRKRAFAISSSSTPACRSRAVCLAGRNTLCARSFKTHGCGRRVGGSARKRQTQPTPTARHHGATRGATVGGGSGGGLQRRKREAKGYDPVGADPWERKNRASFRNRRVIEHAARHSARGTCGPMATRERGHLGRSMGDLNGRGEGGSL